MVDTQTLLSRDMPRLLPAVGRTDVYPEFDEYMSRLQTGHVVESWCVLTRVDRSPARTDQGNPHECCDPTVWFHPDKRGGAKDRWQHHASPFALAGRTPLQRRLRVCG